jgi:purine-nucleoside phosphorylase
MLIERLHGLSPQVLLILGSGLGPVAREIMEPVLLSFDDVGLPTATVPGHEGRLIAGTLANVEVLIQQGRLHLYEGYAAQQVVACVRLAAEVGVTTLIVTNAAGGLRPDLRPQDLLLITDHLNLTGTNPLIGQGVGGIPPSNQGIGGTPPNNQGVGESPFRSQGVEGSLVSRQGRFIDMRNAYDPEFRAHAHEAAAAVGERLVEGVYAGLVGPSYETPAELRMLRTLGADVVGMSTVLEVIAARALGLRVLGFSLVTNVHQPHSVEVDHAKVLAVAAAAGPKVAAVVREVLPRLFGLR